MGTISSSTGLISGMDISSIVKQLMEIESRPLTQLKTRVTTAQTEKTAFQTVSAQIMSAITSVTTLSQSSTFTNRTAASSQSDVLSATVDGTTPLGSYSFLVRSVVSTHQVASLGMSDRDSTPVGAGTLSFEPAAARVDSDTELGLLNGGAGVRRGQIKITDRAGGAATIDLRSAYTMGDVLDAINSQSNAAVRAYVSGDRLVVEDITGRASTDGKLTITNIGTGLTGTDLGITGTESGTGAITSAQDLVRLTTSSKLSTLNDGLGVRYSPGKSDLRFTLADGRSFEINLTDRFTLDTSLGELNGGQGVGAGTIRITNRQGLSRELQLTGKESLNDIRATLASDAYKDLKVTISSVSSSGTLIFSDSTSGTGELQVADISGTIAAQLKLTGEADGANLTGKANYQFNTVNSLIRKVQLARDADGHLNDGSLELALSADGKGIAVTDHSTGAGTTQVESLNGSRALEDLGLTGTFQSGVLSGDRLASGLNTVLLRNLNGGTGVRLGVSSFQLRDGSTRTVDFAGTQTLQDAVNRINATGLMRAEIAAGGTSVVITDTTVGTGSFVASGDTLADLQLEGTSDSGRITGGDLNRKYISESTKLSALNGGKGIGLTAGDGGSVVRFDVTNTAGLTETVVLSGSQHQTVGDVINTLNEVLADKGIQAAVNSAGDGIELFETSPAGAGQLKVADIGSGTVAASLHLAGEASAEHPSVLTGSFAGQVEIGPADTLNDVMDKINEAKLGVRASVLSDGSSGRPYRLVISSDTSGTAGQMAFHTGTSGLGFETLAEAQDARVVVGSIDSPNSIVVSSSSNKVTGVVTGMTLDLAAPSDTAVQVSVTQNVDGIVSSLNTFITAYNATLDRIDELTKYDSETQEKGVLLGDSTIAQVRDRLYRQVSRVLPETYSIRQLSSVGISFSTSGGGKLELDETKLRQAIEDDPTGVKDLFTKVTTSTGSSGKEVVNYVGIAATLKQELKSLTTSSSGLLTQATTRLDDRIELYTNRIDDMQTLLDKKEARYYAQFQAMETALSKLQTQQSALGSLSSLAGTVSTSTSSSKG